MAVDVFAGWASAVDPVLAGVYVREGECAAVVGAGFVGSVGVVVEGDGGAGHGLAGGRAERATDDVAGEEVGLLELAGTGEELEWFGGLFAVVVL